MKAALIFTGLPRVDWIYDTALSWHELFLDLNDVDVYSYVWNQYGHERIPHFYDLKVNNPLDYSLTHGLRRTHGNMGEQWLSFETSCQSFHQAIGTLGESYDFVMRTRIDLEPQWPIHLEDFSQDKIYTGSSHQSWIYPMAMNDFLTLSSPDLYREMYCDIFGWYQEQKDIGYQDTVEVRLRQMMKEKNLWERVERRIALDGVILGRPF